MISKKKKKRTDMTCVDAISKHPNQSLVLLRVLARRTVARQCQMSGTSLYEIRKKKFTDPVLALAGSLGENDAHALVETKLRTSGAANHLQNVEWRVLLIPAVLVDLGPDHHHKVSWSGRRALGKAVVEFSSDWPGV